MGNIKKNIGPMWSREDGTLLGFCLVIGRGDTGVHNCSPYFDSTPSGTATVLDSLVSAAQTSQAAFRDALPTSPDVQGWYDAKTTSDKQELYLAVKAWPY